MDDFERYEDDDIEDQSHEDMTCICRLKTWKSACGLDSMAELKPTTPQATANCYGGTGVHGPYCRQTAIKLVLRQAATEYPWPMYGVNSMAISDT